MSIMTDWEENWENHGVLLNLKDDLRDLKKKRDAYIGDKEDEEYLSILDEIESTECRIDELEYDLGIN